MQGQDGVEDVGRGMEGLERRAGPPGRGHVMKRGAPACALRTVARLYGWLSVLPEAGFQERTRAMGCESCNHVGHEGCRGRHLGISSHQLEIVGPWG